jgi:hypothetical protein
MTAFTAVHPSRLAALGISPPGIALRSLGITKADLDALHRALEVDGISPESSREEFPLMLLEMIELKFVRILVTPEEICVEVTGGVVSCTITRPPRETGTEAK